MKLKFCLSLLALVLFASLVVGQTSNRTRNANLINTTWQLYFRESPNEKWGEPWVKLTLLQGGKLLENGEVCPKASWSIEGRKLFFNLDEIGCGLRGGGGVSVNGNLADGYGQLGMRGTPYLIRLVKLNNQTVAPRESRQPSAANKYIGFRYGSELPGDLKSLGGWLIGPLNGVDYGIDVVRKGKVKMLWFDRVTHRSSSGKAYFEVLDVLPLPAIPQSQRLMYSVCSLGGKYDSEIIAIAVYQSRDKQFFTNVRLAWRVNRLRGRFEEISPKGIKCRSQFYSDW